MDDNAIVLRIISSKTIQKENFEDNICFIPFLLFVGRFYGYPSNLNKVVSDVKNNTN
jgi:hypothetical protein